MKRFFQKKVTKIVSVALSTILITGIAAGCGEKGEDKDEKGRTVISVGGWPTKDGPSKDNAEAIRARFEQANQDVVVEPDSWSFDLKTFYAKAAGGRLPTVYNANFTEVSQIISAGYSADITDALKKYNIYDKINKKVLNLISKDGKTYAYPSASYLLGLAYNVDIFEKAGLMEADGTPKQPKDWNEVLEFALRIKETTGKTGFLFPTTSNYGGWMFTSIAWGFGVCFMEQDNNGKWKAKFDSPECAEALQWIKDLKWKYDVIPANTLINGTEYYKLFGIGEAGMLLVPGDFARRLPTYDMKPEQIGIMAMPSGPQKHVTLMGGGVFAISNKATKDQADAGVRWLQTTETPNATDEYKLNLENEIKKKVGQNELVTIKGFSQWRDDSEAVKFSDEMRTKYANANMNHVRLYNEFVENLGDCEIRPEEPVCAQELYGVFDNCIQEVLTNKDADPATILAKAKSDFQSNYLDNLDY